MPIIPTIEQIRKQQGVTQPIRPVGIWRYPASTENAYTNYLLSFIREIEAEVKKVIVPQIPAWNSESRLDAVDEDLEAIIAAMLIQYEQQAEDNRTQVRVYGNQVDSFNNKEWSRILKRSVGISWFAFELFRDPLKDRWVNENIRLTKNIVRNTLTSIQTTIINGISQGKTNDVIIREITGIGKLKKTAEKVYNATKSVFTKAKNNVKRIASDQIQKLNGKFTQNRELGLDISRYKWRNMRDNRVRGNPAGKYPNSMFNHWSREGRIFKWSEPPGDGHPGQPIECRCFAEPVFTT